MRPGCKSSLHSGQPWAKIGGDFKGVRTLGSPSLTMRDPQWWGGVSPKITQEVGSRTGTISGFRDSVSRSPVA